MGQRDMGDSTRIRQLDGVRGVAIVMVLAWHYLACQEVSQGMLPAGVAASLSLMWSGVDLFFVLSGFLIAGILLDNRGAANYFRVFYARRTCRILPLYFLVLLAYLALVAAGAQEGYSLRFLFDDPLPAWSFATFTQNIVMGLEGHYGQRFLGATWSLAVEEQFYLFVPLLVYALPRRVLPAVLVGLIGLAPLLRWASPGLHAFVNTPWRGDSLLAGALLAVLVRWAPFVPAVRRHVRVVVGLLTALLLGAGVISWRPAAMGVFNHTWLAALYCVVILLAYVREPATLGRVLGSGLLVWLGRLSYGIYLFHQIALGLVFWWMRGGPPTLGSAGDGGLILLALGLTLGTAVLSFRYVESPFLRYGQQWRYAATGASMGDAGSAGWRQLSATTSP
jgi:peptidoglycan/LPS O-acetylase OafA/YrhL